MEGIVGLGLMLTGLTIYAAVSVVVGVGKGVVKLGVWAYHEIPPFVASVAEELFAEPPEVRMQRVTDSTVAEIDRVSDEYLRRS
jgi:hypothetical protein